MVRALGVFRESLGSVPAANGGGRGPVGEWRGPTTAETAASTGLPLGRPE